MSPHPRPVHYADDYDFRPLCGAGRVGDLGDLGWPPLAGLPQNVTCPECVIKLMAAGKL